MGEIKSTLDIVLEKTKHLTMGSEERKRQAREDVQKKMKGLVQKFQEHKVRLDQLENEVNRLQESYDLDCRKILIHEILGRLDANQENSSLISLLKRLCRFDTALLEKELRSFQKETQLLESRITGEILQNVSEKFNLSGSAIVPNLENHEVWKRGIDKIQNNFNEMIKNMIEM